MGPKVPLELKVAYVMILNSRGYRPADMPLLKVKVSAGKEQGQTPVVKPEEIFSSFWGVFFAKDAPAVVTLPWDASTQRYTPLQYEIFAGGERIASCQHTLTSEEAQVRLASVVCGTLDTKDPLEILFHLRAEGEPWGALNARRPIGDNVSLEIKATLLIIGQEYTPELPPLMVKISAGEEVGQTPSVQSEALFSQWSADFPNDAPAMATLHWDTNSGSYEPFQYEIFAGTERIANCQHTLSLEEAQIRIATIACETFDETELSIFFHLKAVESVQ